MDVLNSVWNLVVCGLQVWYTEGRYKEGMLLNKLSYLHQKIRSLALNRVVKWIDFFGEWNLRPLWNVTSGIYAKYQEQIMLLFVYTTTRKRFVIFTCRYFKLSWNTTALSQSNCRNFSCSSITLEILLLC